MHYIYLNSFVKVAYPLYCKSHEQFRTHLSATITSVLAFRSVPSCPSARMGTRRCMERMWSAGIRWVGGITEVVFKDGRCLLFQEIMCGNRSIRYIICSLLSCLQEQKESQLHFVTSTALLIKTLPIVSFKQTKNTPER